MSFPNIPALIATYINGLEAFPVDPATSVRYGYTDSRALPVVQVNDCKITAPDWTTAGPVQYVSDFSISCFAKSNEEVIELASAVNDLFNQQQITTNTQLCEFISLQVVQEDQYRFHAQLDYRLQEGI